MASILTLLLYCRAVCHLASPPCWLASDTFVFLYSPAFVRLYCPTEPSHTITASSLGQDNSCPFYRAQQSRDEGPFGARLIHCIQTSGLVTEQGWDWQEMRPFLAPQSLPTASHQREQKRQMGRMCARKELKQCPSEWKVSRWLW